MSISPETIDLLRGEFRALPPKRRAALTARDAVVALAPEIRATRAAGYSLADIAGQLGSRGVAISASTPEAAICGRPAREAGKQKGRGKRRTEG
ncbi:hypothetical protein SAMN04487972_1553 [Paracoccus halophilus]|uniref:Uncharacterized protein n=1 Tax=Paracoccus halophilus TaxID=376733 RepID=A0A099EUQ4_9RHOB|nr:hypothetical protein [Paracoccus halophilus]KGJ01737.1 hypothetical protein IT41_19375 [Paracoccus halophilus]SFA62663.1 hypothetical protein SAMN04487972_1553 [Paracoccus halophilus]